MPTEEAIWSAAQDVTLWGVALKAPCVEHMAWHSIQQFATGLLAGEWALKEMVDLDYIQAQPEYRHALFTGIGEQAGGLGLLKLTTILRVGDLAAGGAPPHSGARLGCSWFWRHADDMFAGRTGRVWRNVALVVLPALLDTWPLRLSLVRSRLQKSLNWQRGARLICRRRGGWHGRTPR
jgi:hypothetical protein